MAEHRWTLIDHEADACESVFEISGRDIPGTPSDWRVSKRTLQAGLSQGVDLVEIDNGRLKFAVLPTRRNGAVARLGRRA